MAQEDTTSSLEAKFDAAVRVIRSLPEDGPYQPSDNMMLMFYSYYKQATLGPCNSPRPIGFWDSRGKAKWDAWSSLGNMTREEAMINYVDDIQLILETIPISEEVSELVEKLGNFYSDVDGAGEHVEKNEVDKRAFTRPFADCAGFGDLWEDIQNPGNDRKTANDLCLAICDEERPIGGIMSDSGVDKHNNREHMLASNDDDSITNSSRVYGNEDSSDSEISDVGENSEGDNTEDGDEEEEVDEEEPEGGPEWSSSPYPRLQVWEEGRWSVSSGDPSVSSVPNGIHSSLNSQQEDQELASLEPPARRSSHARRSDNRGVMPEKTHRTPDSDNEEFCDSMEHLAMEEVSGIIKFQSSGSRRSSARRRVFAEEALTTFKSRGEDVTHLGQPLLEYEFGTVRTQRSTSRRARGSPSPRPPCGSPRCVHLAAACPCVSAPGHAGGVAVGHAVNEQTAATLLRLQEDMADVLHRLNALEVLTISQSRSTSPRNEEASSLARKFIQFRKHLWWPLPFSPVTAVLMTFWPLVAHWLVQLYLQRRRRKIC